MKNLWQTVSGKFYLWLMVLCVMFGSGWAKGAQVQAQQGDPPPLIKKGSVEFTGSLRTRYENWGWFDVPGRDSQQDFVGTLFRFALKGKHSLNDTHSIEWAAEAAFPSLIGLPRNAVAPAPQGALGLGGTYAAGSGDERASIFLKQAYLRWGIKGQKFNTGIKIGRFEFSEGAELPATDPTIGALKRTRIQERLIGPFGFTHVGRSFDGGQLSFGTSTTNVTVLAARPTEGVFQLDGMRQIPGVSVVYASFNKALHAHKVNDKTQHQGEARVFGLYYRDTRSVLKTDNRSITAREADRQNDINVTTIGGHYVRDFKLGKGKADVLVWGAGQFGSWGNLDQRAGSIVAEVGYQPEMKWNPWIRAGFTHSTGDDDPTDNEHGTFFQVLPTPRIYARTPFFNMMNNQDIFAEVIVRPTKKLNIRSDFHSLALSSRKDLWYIGGGAFQKQTFGYVGRPSSNYRSLGALLDVSVDYQVSSRVGLSFYYGQMFGGRVVSSIYPSGQNGHFGYAELSFRF